jgi:hypothetical protein
MTNLISDRLVELVEKHADLILKRWAMGLMADPTTSSFTGEHLKYMTGKARQVMENLDQWISFDTSKEDIGRLYAVEGKEYFGMGIPLCEIHRALVVLRKTLWIFVMQESAFDSVFQLYQMKELNDRIILFFDRAEYYTIRGYVESMYQKLKEDPSCSRDSLDAVFFRKSFYAE